MPNAHCIPSGALGTGEIPVCNVDAHNTTAYLPPSGLKRGVVVAMHGVSVGQTPIPAYVAVDGTGPVAFESYGYSLMTQLTNDGWVYLAVPYPEDFYVSTGALGIYNDIINDSGNGSRYLNMTLHWWDHVVNFIHNTYGHVPIVASGGSWGGWHTLQVAANRQSTIVGYEADVPATLLTNASPAFTGGASFSTINTSGLNISTTHLNNVTVPGIVTYGTNDEAVGYSSTTVASGTANVTTFTSGSGVIAVADTTQLVTGPLITLTGLTGGTGTAVVSFVGKGTVSISATSGSGSVVTITTTYPHGLTTGQSTTLSGYTGSFAGLNGQAFTATVTSSTQFTIVSSLTGTIGGSPSATSTGNLTGVTYVQGSGSLVAGANVVQSTTNAMITSAVNAGQPVTRNATANTHELTNADSGTYYTGSTVNLSGLTTLNVNATADLVSGQCAILASDGAWHSLTFTGTSGGNQFTGCSFGGSLTGVTISANAPVCMTGTGAVGNHQMSIPYWFYTVLDPSYPKQY